VVELSLAPGAGQEIHTAADLDTYLGALADAGFANVSLSLEQLAGDLPRAAAMLATHGLRCRDVLALQVSRHEDTVFERTERLAEAAEALGAEFVLALFWSRVNEESIDRFGRCADVVNRVGARLALEMPPIGELNSIGASLAIVDAVGVDRAALMIDTFHFMRGSSTWLDLETFPVGTLGYVQFDDALAPVTDDVMHETVNRRTMPGDGEFDLDRFATTLRHRGWSGLVSVEVLSAELRLLDIGTFARRAFESCARYWSDPKADGTI
jgi:sugar phosphate isomerase/epimerase